MRVVRDETGRTFHVRKQSEDGWLLRDLETGQETHRPASELEPVEGESPLETAARTIPEPVRSTLRAGPTDRALGLLVEIERDGPLSVRAMLDRYALCESALHGHLAEFRIAGLLLERRVAGERGYETTDLASEALTTLRANDPDR